MNSKMVLVTLDRERWLYFNCAALAELESAFGDYDTTMEHIQHCNNRDTEANRDRCMILAALANQGERMRAYEDGHDVDSSNLISADVLMLTMTPDFSEIAKQYAAIFEAFRLGFAVSVESEEEDEKNGEAAGEES